jgi:4'-phosphopantetheinyl transferase
MDATERDRLGRFRREADRARFTVGSTIVRMLAGAALGVPPETVVLDRSCSGCGRPHHVPRVPGSNLRFSVSHSGDTVVVAATQQARVGVDVEALDPRHGVDELARPLLGPAESPAFRGLTPEDRHRAFFTIWCRKEAVLKALGVGLQVPLPAVTVTAAQDPARLLAYDPDPALVPEIQLWDLHPIGGYAAALAVCGGAPGGIAQLDADRLLNP